MRFLIKGDSLSFFESQKKKLLIIRFELQAKLHLYTGVFKVCAGRAAETVVKFGGNASQWSYPILFNG